MGLPRSRGVTKPNPVQRKRSRSGIEIPACIEQTRVRGLAGVREAWEAIRFTGYGEAVRLLAKHVYGIDEITAEAARAAAPRLRELRRPGERLRLLRDVANLDHTQTDDFCWPCRPDASGPDFFLYDLSWAGFCSGEINLEEIERETGVAVRDLVTLDQAMAA